MSDKPVKSLFDRKMEDPEFRKQFQLSRDGFIKDLIDGYSADINKLSASLEAARKKNLELEIKLREPEAEKKKNRELLDRLKTSEEALEGLLDGLDENNDDRCGLSMEEWQKRVKQARDALKPEK